MVSHSRVMNICHCALYSVWDQASVQESLSQSHIFLSGNHFGLVFSKNRLVLFLGDTAIPKNQSPAKIKGCELELRINTLHLMLKIC